MELYDAEEAIGMRKILAHDMRMEKNPQTKEDTSWVFTDFHGVMRAQSQTCTPARKFHHLIGVTNPEIVYILLLFQIFRIDCFFFFRKNTYFYRKLIKF